MNFLFCAVLTLLGSSGHGVLGRFLWEFWNHGTLGLLFGTCVVGKGVWGTLGYIYLGTVTEVLVERGFEKNRIGEKVCSYVAGYQN